MRKAYALNLLDLAFTLHALRHGAVELNPLMQSVPVQIFYKVFVVGALLYLLDRLKQYRLARWGINISVAAFAAAVAWHIVNLIFIWRCFL